MPARNQSDTTSNGSGLAHHDCAADFVGLEAECHRSPHAGQDDYVVELFNDALDAQPMHDVAGPEVDYLQGALRLGVSRRQCLVQVKASKGFVVARFRQSDDGMVADEAETAQVALACPP